MQPRFQRNLIRITTVALILIVVAGTVYLFATQDAAFLLYLQDVAASRPVLAMAVFAAVHFMVVVTGVPGTNVAGLVGGYLFGLVAGVGVIAAVTVIGSILTWLWASRVARTQAERMQRFPLVGRIERLVAGDPFHYLLLVRIVPVFPLFGVNVALALLRISWPRFLATTTLGVTANVSIYAGVGSSLGDILTVREMGLTSLLARPGFWLPMTALVVLIGSSMVVRRRIRRINEARG